MLGKLERLAPQAHWLLLGAIVLVHGPRWSFAPAEGYPLGCMEFQVILLLIAGYFLVTGNRQGSPA